MDRVTKVTEGHIQAVLMRWLLTEKHHHFCIPNSNQFFTWEADLISVTRAGLIHEFEIKLNVYDYKADAKKLKHNMIGHERYAPAYFWYVAYDFEIEPPENAGWIFVTQIDTRNGRNNGWELSVKREAPRLNDWKITDRKTEQVARILSWRLYNWYEGHYLHHRNDRKEKIEA
ncbi:MAG: hypothetical protein C4575_13035 [Desulforudis sp.]|nr:MAG: hypothetical protein C4575_13035 [Desulforudis sp.]